jgi:hypothetical protein
MTYARQPLISKRYFESKAMGEWLGSFSWDLFATMTLKVYFTPKQLEWLFVNFITKLDKEIAYFWAIERHRDREATHLHTLLGNLKNVDQRLSLETWAKKYGRYQIEDYNSLEKGCFYVVKNISTPRLIAWDVSESLRYLPKVKTQEESNG